MERFEFTGFGGVKLPAVIWLPEGEVRRVVQIAHGMTEHMDRYEALAGELTAQGAAVAGFDLRGHGRNPGSPDVASLGENGWEASLEDMHLFSAYLCARFPGAEHDMLGFSLGSFLLREYLGRWSEGVSRAVIMGTGQQHALVLSVIMAIVKGQIVKGGFDNTTDLVRRLSFGTYNQKFRPNRTESDWLCADEAGLNAYLADPLCRKDISSGLFWQLLGAMKRCAGKHACRGWNREMPVLLLSGEDDPVGDSGKGVLAVKKQLQDAGMKQVSVQLLPGARHIVLEEQACGAAQQAKRAILDFLLG
ncbi:MAG: alpha/beta fold hydrolase [Clostridia bacterium]|nr:alpha/beta fold hydrolase [Clostridia bacterium]